MRMIKVLTIKGVSDSDKWDFSLPENLITGLVSLLGAASRIPRASQEQYLEMMFKDQDDEISTP